MAYKNILKKWIIYKKHSIYLQNSVLYNLICTEDFIVLTYSHEAWIYHFQNKPNFIYWILFGITSNVADATMGFRLVNLTANTKKVWINPMIEKNINGCESLISMIDNIMHNCKWRWMGWTKCQKNITNIIKLHIDCYTLSLESSNSLCIPDILHHVPEIPF